MRRYLVLGAGLALSGASAVSGMPHDLGVDSSTISAGAHEIAVLAEAVLVDEGAAAELGCGIVPCDDLRAELGLTGRRVPGQGALSFLPVPAGALRSHGGYAQFEALTWVPGRRLDLLFGFVAFDPAVTVATQSGAALHSTLLFRLGDTFGPLFAHFPVSVRASSHESTVQAVSAAPPAVAPGGTGQSAHPSPRLAARF